MPAVSPDEVNLVESTRSPVFVILPNSIAPLAQIAIGGPEGSQVDAGVAGRGGGGNGSLLMGGNAFAAMGSLG